MPNRSEYHSFLLRLWRVNRESPWRISLTRVGGEEQLVFRQIEDVLEFLEAEMHSERNPEDAV